MKKILNLLNRKQLVYFLLFGIAVLFLSIIEIFIFSLVQPIISTLSGSNTNLDINNNFINFFIPDKFFNSDSIIFLFFIVFALRSVVTVAISYIRQNLNRSIDEEISIKLYSKYIHKDYIFFLKENSSSFVSNIIVEIDKFAYRLMDSLTYFIVDTVIVVTISLYLLINYLVPTIFLIIIIGLIFLIFYLFHKNKFKQLGVNRSNADLAKVSWLQKSFYSIQSIKLDNIENYFQEKFDEEVKKSSASLFKMNFISELPKNLADLILISVGASLLYTLHSFAAIEKTLFLSVLGLFVIAMFRILPSANRILYTFSSIKFHYQTVNVLDQLINDKEKLNIIKSENVSQSPTIIKKLITLENITFSYDVEGKTRKILNNINLEIKKNKIIGICGKNGSGKSTLLNIITGLLDPSMGEVKLDGKSIKNFKHLYQSTIGYVTQKTYLTDDSVIENIIFGKKKLNYDQKKLQEAINVAQLEDVINDLPDKENTLLGERGSKLSGGQQQRIGIARALYKNPQIVVFDEATSALDSDSQKKILLSTVLMKSLGKTIIIVSHDEGVFEICDEVYRIEQGTLTRLKA